jgi:hypothetical protein
MSAVDRLLITLALALTLFGCAELYASAQDAVRQTAACQKGRLPQVTLKTVSGRNTPGAPSM